MMDVVTCEPMDHIPSQTGRDIRETGRKERAEKGIVECACSITSLPKQK